MTTPDTTEETYPHLLVLVPGVEVRRIAPLVEGVLSSMGLARICYDGSQLSNVPAADIRKAQGTPANYDPRIGIHTAVGLVTSHGIDRPHQTPGKRNIVTEVRMLKAAHVPDIPEASLIPERRLLSDSFYAYCQTRGLGKVNQVTPGEHGVGNIIIPTPDGADDPLGADSAAAFVSWLGQLAEYADL